jgi:hypothetical protein
MYYYQNLSNQRKLYSIRQTAFISHLNSIDVRRSIFDVHLLYVVNIIIRILTGWIKSAVIQLPWIEYLSENIKI